MAFIGDFSPVFFIAYIVYLGFVLSLYLIPLLITFLCNLIWLQIFNRKYLEKKCGLEQYEIVHIEDMGKGVISYFLSLTISLYYMVFLSPLKGMIVLFFFMVFIYLIFSTNRIFLFNPFLMARGYYQYEVRTKDGSTIYVISREPMHRLRNITFYRLDEYLYFERIVYLRTDE